MKKFKKHELSEEELNSVSGGDKPTSSCDDSSTPVFKEGDLACLMAGTNFYTLKIIKVYPNKEKTGWGGLQYKYQCQFVSGGNKGQIKDYYEYEISIPQGKLSE